MNYETTPEALRVLATHLGDLAGPLIAVLTRPGTIAAGGITLTHRTPALAICRALIAAGYTDQPLTVIDTATGRPSMFIGSIVKAAKLTVKETNQGPRFVEWFDEAGKEIYGEKDD